MRALSEHVRCFGNRHFNLFLVGQTQAALVECGVSGAVANLRQQWEATLSPGPEIEHLLAMHAHFDHTCGIPALKQMFPSAAITASTQAQKVLSKPHILKDFFSQDERMIHTLKEEGLLNPDVDVKIPNPQHIDVEFLVHNGDEIKIESGIYLKIIAAPGHSPDSLAAYLACDQTLFISDAAGFQIADHDFFPVFFQSYPLYMETLKELRGYPTRLLALPHGTIWTGGEIETFYQEAQSAADEVFNIIRNLSENGKDKKTIQDILFKRYYRGDLRIYTADNISTCVELLVRRVQECL